MFTLQVPPPQSGGLILSYKCNSRCKHCMYACSPDWPADWISRQDLETCLDQLSGRIQPSMFGPESIDLASGLHYTGGEPFLNFELLLTAVQIGEQRGIPSTFVETNGNWCVDQTDAEDKLTRLKEAGLKGLMISVNPFLLEHVPFDRTRLCVQAGRTVFGDSCVVYQQFFYNQFCEMELEGTIDFGRYLEEAGTQSLRYVEVIPMGRLPFTLGTLFKRKPAETFFKQSCRQTVQSPHHVHVDNYGNYMPGFCGGLSLGDARTLDNVLKGVELDRRPVLAAVANRLEHLYRLGEDHGYRERPEGYVSGCHLCLDIRRHLAQVTDEFAELSPARLYEQI